MDNSSSRRRESLSSAFYGVKTRSSGSNTAVTSPIDSRRMSESMSQSLTRNSSRSFVHASIHQQTSDSALNPAFSSLREQTAGLAALALEQDLLDKSDYTPRPRRGSIITTDSFRAIPMGSSPSKYSTQGSNGLEEWPSGHAPVYPHRGTGIASLFKTRSGSSGTDQNLYNVSSLGQLDEESLIDDEQEPLLDAQYAYSSLNGLDQPSRRPNLSPHLEYHTFNNRVPGEENNYFASFRPSSWSKRARRWVSANLSTDECIKRPLGYIPSVVLGVLLNILDGLSYGMILFPLTNPIFAALGPAGLSMFYVSCVVSQLVYSLGASNFHSGVGSEMIEVVPFFHSMTATLVAEIGEENPHKVISTAILAYALSSIVTGLVFFSLGYAKLGSLVGFFPRHILVGCIGGVGWFLVVTGLEVSSRMNGNIEYNWETLKFLLDGITLLKWTTPLLLAFILVFVQKYTHHPLLVPCYFIGVFALFHFVVFLVPSLSFQDVRDAGWLFQGPKTSEPWWYFYTLYDFTAVDYFALAKTIPAMFALTFFGILHVPINVPALAASIGEDNVDVDRELLAHGISNALSGLLGSIQNYLVYTNSVLFIRSGADSRMAGVMLAMATFGVMLAGPDVIGFIPVMVVGALIFLLGIELLVEALVDTYGRVSRFEYFTILVIVVTMGAWDFVSGIIVGIVLACVSFVIQASQRSAIKATYTGAVARSTVRRNAAQQRFLAEVGDQIFVLKLSGNIFFGTIVRIEKAVRDLLDDSYFNEKPIKYLILDISAVTAIDFSAAEAFARMKRLLNTKHVYMIITGASDESGMIQALRAVGLLEQTYDVEDATKTDFDSSNQVRLFPNLNSALEWSENEFLKSYYLRRDQLKSINTPISDANRNLTVPTMPKDDIVGSPRVAFIHQVADKAVLQDPQIATSKLQHYQQPVPILMQTFQGISNERESFWLGVAPFFKREEHKAGEILYTADTDATGFYIIESGILRADSMLEQGEIYETILAGTTCGELPFFSETPRTATITVEADAVVWKLDRDSWFNMRDENEEGLRRANEFYRIALKLTVERFASVMAYILISSSR